jgi:hypothetical protein
VNDNNKRTSLPCYKLFYNCENDDKGKLKISYSYFLVVLGNEFANIFNVLEVGSAAASEDVDPGQPLLEVDDKLSELGLRPMS